MGPESSGMSNKDVLTRANAAVSAGDYEGFLSFCSADTHWTFVGDGRGLRRHSHFRGRLLDRAR